MSTSWEPAFLAVSATLGEPYDAALAAVGDAGALHAAAMVRGLRSTKREARAQAIASVLAEIVRDLDDTRLTWP